MKLSLYLACLMLLFVFVSSELHFNVSAFVEVILHLRKFYSVATVMFAHPGDAYGDYGDLRITHLVHTCAIMLGRHYVVTFDVHFRKLRRSLRYYRKIVQPLAIVIMPDYGAFLEFAEATKNYKMSFPVWFLLFLYTPDNSTHDYCHDPIGNPLNLAFDTQMLVLCADDDEILREWYSVKGETTKVFDLAKWTDNNGFILLTKLSLYDRKKDMEGVVLRAVTVKDTSVSPKYTESYVGGLYGKVLDELTCSLNFTLDVVSEVNQHGLWNKKNKTWSGVMGEIVSGRADFAIADMSMTSLRVRYVDFTLPLIISRNDLYVKEPGICGVKWQGYFQAFHSRTWVATLVLIAITPLLLCLMKICRGSRNIADLISDNFIYIWGIFCQQALTEFPSPSSLRIAYFTIFCTAILISAYYSAALVCFLTACVRVLPFRTIDEFVNDGTYRLIVPRGSADYDIFVATNESFSLKLMKMMKEESELPMTLIDGFMQVCQDKRLAYLALNALKKSVQVRIPCKLSSIRTERIDNLGMILSKGNPYTGVINYHLQKFLDNGMMMRLRDTRFLMESAENKDYQPVRLTNVIPILSLLSLDLNVTTMIHTWTREFTRQRVMTVTVTFLNLVSEYNEYRKTVRPLLVILLDTEESIDEFARATRSVESISFPIWLVLFLQLPGHSLEAHCRRPTGNIFNVNFNTMMLVLCYDRSILTEWYAVNDNRTRTLEFATWSPDRGLILTARRKSFYARRGDLFGEVMRVASVYHAKNPILQKVSALMKEKNLLPLVEADGFKQVCEKKNVAFYTTEMMANAVELQCKTVFIETGKADSMGIVLRKESPYTGIMNYHIRRFMNNGVMNRLKEKYLSTSNLPEVQHIEVGLQGVAPILAVMATGVVLGVFILMLEKAYYVFKIRCKNGLAKNPSDKAGVKL
ncbi:PREDICTED: uncharacterized protein LOC106740710 [Dinoponera quadriceps]|uniref:Uncharacterized protein LOC106740710 n=1 Tax=Dinoponera quadriceps TaxID=609295 RepID=A0A6P3WNS9_DINQU|nr:PREDICTED: uncharacterized protein LOC106740710 [Dinoponera quadriceps]